MESEKGFIPFVKRYWKIAIIVILLILFISKCSKSNRYERTYKNFQNECSLKMDSLEHEISRRDFIIDSLEIEMKSLETQRNIYSTQLEKVSSKKNPFIIKLKSEK